jgi:hypothetical protein
MPAERRHPHAGVKDSKPRARVPKLPAEELTEQSRIYLAERNKAMRPRFHRNLSVGHRDAGYSSAIGLNA